jgi:uncharacterized protein (TIGR02246 family)
MPTRNFAESEQVIQKARIRDVLEAYFYALDSGDEDALAACFTPDVEAIYQQGRPEERHHAGRDGLLRQLTHSAAASDVRTHSGSSVHILLRGAAATATTHATATIVKEQQVTVRGLRYKDELALEDGEWRIRRRVHIPLWQYEVARAELAGSRPMPDSVEHID